MSETTTEEKSLVRVLFVDDEANILRSLRRLFMDEEGLEIETAASGEEALDILRRHSDVGLIVSDQRMPGLSGVDFLEQARNIAPEAVRIILTGYADVNAAIDAINRGGAFRYITKPWVDETLVRTVKDGIALYNLKHENERLTALVKKQNDELQRWNTQLEWFVEEQTVEITKKNTQLEVLNTQLKKNFNDSITIFASILELRDKASRNHSKNVSEMSAKVARAMKMGEEEIEAVRIAGLLHDIGKIGISDALLVKPTGEMSEEEFKIYRQHPVRGQAAVDSIEDLRAAGLLIRHHHEAYDGTGFPDHLKGNDIPQGARIIAVADFIDKSAGTYTGLDTASFLTVQLREAGGSLLDRKTIHYFEEMVWSIYSGASQASDMEEIEIPVYGLKPGMTLARDSRSGTGLLLLKKNSVINDKSLAALKRYYQLDPPKTGVFIWRKKAA